jgi:hypothetical protein
MRAFAERLTHIRTTAAVRRGTTPKMALSQIGLVGLAVMGQVSSTRRWG